MRGKPLVVLVALLVFAAASFAASAPPIALKITRVTPDFGTQMLLIEGTNFGPSPLVSLAAGGGAIVPLSVVSASDTSVLAILPTIAPGTYLLVVAREKRRYWTRLRLDSGIAAGYFPACLSTSIIAGSLLIGSYDS